jgi:rhodanese-related sulfurtransferase
MKLNKTALFAALIIAPLVTFGVPILLTKVLTKDTVPEEVTNPTKKVTRSATPQQKLVDYVNIDVRELKSYIDDNKDIYLLDVHIPEQEHISSTDAFIPFDELEAYKAELPEDKDTEIVIYCRSGNMSEMASQELIDMGYTNVKNLTGGIQAWKSEGYEL